MAHPSALEEQQVHLRVQSRDIYVLLGAVYASVSSARTVNALSSTRSPFVKVKKANQYGCGIVHNKTIYQERKT